MWSHNDNLPESFHQLPPMRRPYMKKLDEYENLYIILNKEEKTQLNKISARKFSFWEKSSSRIQNLDKEPNQADKSNEPNESHQPDEPHQPRKSNPPDKPNESHQPKELRKPKELEKPKKLEKPNESETPRNQSIEKNL